MPKKLVVMLLSTTCLGLTACPTSPVCSLATCTLGCCSAAGRCESGATTAACGRGGNTCSSCSLGQTCDQGVCGSFSGTGAGVSGGGPAVGGGTAGAGGSSGGGNAGDGGSQQGSFRVTPTTLELTACPSVSQIGTPLLGVTPTSGLITVVNGSSAPALRDLSLADSGTGFSVEQFLADGGVSPLTLPTAITFAPGTSTLRLIWAPRVRSTTATTLVFDDRDPARLDERVSLVGEAFQLPDQPTLETGVELPDGGFSRCESSSIFTDCELDFGLVQSGLSTADRVGAGPGGQRDLANPAERLRAPDARALEPEPLDPERHRRDPGA